MKTILTSIVILPFWIILRHILMAFLSYDEYLITGICFCIIIGWNLDRIKNKLFP